MAYKDKNRAKEYAREWRKLNPGYAKAYNKKNKDKRSAYTKKWKEENKERWNDYKKQWRKKHCKEHKEEYKKRAKKYALQYPEKAKARSNLRQAVRRGTVKKPMACSECGKRKKQIEGHHSDYSKRFDVIWLCNSCHKKLHLKESA